VVLVEEFEDFVEVAHVFAEEEAEVAYFDLLVVDEALDILPDELHVPHCRELVQSPRKQCSGHLIDLLQVDVWGSALAVTLEVVFGAVVELLEAAAAGQLYQVHQRFGARAPRVVIEKHLKSVLLVFGGLLVGHLDDDPAEEVGEGAHPFHPRLEQLLLQEHDPIRRLRVQIVVEELVVVGEPLPGLGGGAVEDGGAAQDHKQGELVLVVLLVLRQRHHHVRRPLRVPHISNLRRPSHIQDVVEDGREVVVGVLFEGEVPEGVHAAVQVLMPEAVFVASVVADPEVVAGVGEEEGGGLVGLMGQDRIRGVADAWPPKDRRLRHIRRRPRTWNSDHFDYISIVGVDEVLFVVESVVPDELDRLLLAVLVVLLPRERILRETRQGQ